MQRAEMPPRNLFARAVLQAYLAAHPIADEHVRQEYERRRRTLVRRREYRVRHVLVLDERRARQIARDLARDGRCECRGPATGGGAVGSSVLRDDLQWISVENSDPAIIAAVAALPAGGCTREPVRTRSGWHVLQLQVVHEATLLPYDVVKESIRRMLDRKRLDLLMRELQGHASAS